MTEVFNPRFASPRTPFSDFAPRADAMIEALHALGSTRPAFLWTTPLQRTQVLIVAVVSQEFGRASSQLTATHVAEARLHQDATDHPESALLPQDQLLDILRKTTTSLFE